MLTEIGNYCVPSTAAMNLWHSAVSGAHKLSETLPTVAMAVVGLQTRVSAFRQIGFRPLLLAMLTAAAVGAVSLVSIRLLLESA